MAGTPPSPVARGRATRYSAGVRGSKIEIGKRVAAVSMLVSGLLAVAKIVLGLMGRSVSVFSDGLESAGDVIASGLVFLGFVIAARPADEDHPYGHGRFETISGLVVGLILFMGGIGICLRALRTVGVVHEPPALYGIWPLLASIVAKLLLSTTKFRYGRRIGSAALVADAWNDAVDIVSAGAALTALGLTLYDPARFAAADHYGGFAVGLIVIFTGLRVSRDTALRLTDVMPDPALLVEIRRVALTVPGVSGVEKCFARSSGLQYHVDLHLEVDPEMSVRQSHEIATAVRFKIREQLDWVADVLVHVEPHGLSAPGAPRES
jgi:cation diffusion facilitator family transporter